MRVCFPCIGCGVCDQRTAPALSLLETWLPFTFIKCFLYTHQTLLEALYVFIIYMYS